jgi:hypothetical protein
VPLLLAQNIAIFSSDENIVAHSIYRNIWGIQHEPKENITLLTPIMLYNLIFCLFTLGLKKTDGGLSSEEFVTLLITHNIKFLTEK